MNLRDLIFSQTQASDISSSQAAPRRSPPKSPAATTKAIPTSSFSQREEDADVENSSSDESEVLPTKRSRGPTGGTRSETLPVYRNAPKVKQRAEILRLRKTGASMPVYAPGMQSFLRFPSSHHADISSQRALLQHLWHQCYFGKDFEGAAMTLGVIAEVDPVRPHDITMAAHLLRYSDSADVSIKKLVQGVLKPFTRSGERKSDAIKVSIELLLSQGDVAAARKLLQDNIVDLTYQGRTEMLCYDTLVLVACTCNLATEICRLSGKSIALPDLEAIQRDPLSFSKCVKVLNTVRNAPALMNNKIKTKRQECKLLLQDLKASFNLSVAGTAVVHDRMAMEALYVGYLMGLEHTSKASRYLANLRNLLPTSGDAKADAPLQAEYYRLLSAYLVRCRYSLPEVPIVVAVRGSIWADAAVSSSGSGGGAENLQAVYAVATADAPFVRISNALIKQCDYLCRTMQAPTLGMYYNVYALYRTGILDDEACIERLCSMIEMVNPSLECTEYNRYGGYQRLEETQLATSDSVLRYLLWKALCEALGPVSPVLTAEQQIAANTDVMQYITGVASAVAAGSVSLVSGDASAAEERAETSLGKRGWWRSSILCAAQLDAFHQSAVVPSAQQVEAILRHCTSSSDADDASVTSTGGESSVKLVLEDSYAVWLHSEKAFDETLEGAFTAMKRKMSDEDSEGEGYWKDGQGQDGNGSGDDDEGTAGVGGEASQMSNTSHDEAEYHSQDSGIDAGATQEDSGAPGGASSGTTQPRAALRFVQEILSIAVQGQESEYATGEHRRGAGCGVTVLPALRAPDFAVKKTILRAPAGSRNRAPRVEYTLGDRQLEILACQAVVSAHLCTQDNMFTVRAAMVILQHAMRTNAASTENESTQAVRNCVGIIVRGGINIQRVLKIGQALAAKAVDPARPPY